MARRRPSPAAALPADERDPHLRLPRPLRVARMALAAFVVITSYFALGVPSGAGEAARLVVIRLVFEAFAALVVLLALPWRPAPARLAAMGLAAFVLLGCVPSLAHIGAALAAGAPATAWLTALLALAACAAQAVVLAACLSVRRESLSAP